MKPVYSRLSLLFIAAILFLITCKSPVNKSIQKETDNSLVEELSITQLQQGYKTGKYTVKDVVKIYLDRINEIDKNGPKLNSVIDINPDALMIAEEMDKQLSTGKPLGSLFGVPVILKDNIDTRDKMPTTGGATALQNTFPKSDSHVARKLREAGAVIIAKSNLS